jgi:hypothetical protein
MNREAAAVDGWFELAWRDADPCTAPMDLDGAKDLLQDAPQTAPAA